MYRKSIFFSWFVHENMKKSPLKVGYCRKFEAFYQYQPGCPKGPFPVEIQIWQSETPLLILLDLGHRLHRIQSFFFLQFVGRNSGKNLNLNASQAQLTNQDKKYLTKRNVYCPTLQPDCLMDHSKICYQKKTCHKMYSKILTENDQPETLVQGVDQVLSSFLTNNDRQTLFPSFLRQEGYRHTRFSCV